MVTFNHCCSYLAFNGSPKPSTHCGSADLIPTQIGLGPCPVILEKSEVRNKHKFARGPKNCSHVHFSFISFPLLLPIVFISALFRDLILMSHPHHNIKRAYFYLLIWLKFAKIEGTLIRPKFSYSTFPQRFCKDCKKVFLP